MSEAREWLRRARSNLEFARKVENAIKALMIEKELKLTKHIILQI